MNGFERRKKQKKESIGRAALELFRTYGFKKVSVHDIAQKAGVSPVTIYNYYGSRNALVNTVVKELFMNLLERFRSILQGEGSFAEKLEAIVFDKTEIAGQFHGELAQTLFQSSPNMKRFVDSVWRRDVAELTIDLLEEGRRQGYVDAELSQEALLAYLEIVRKGVSASPDLLAGGEPVAGFYRELNHLILYGMVGKKDRIAAE